MRWLVVSALLGASACVYDEECAAGYVSGPGDTCVPEGGPDGGPVDGGTADAGDGGEVDLGDADGGPLDGGQPDLFVPEPGRLAGLELVLGQIDGTFAFDTLDYTGFVGALNESVRVRARAAEGTTIEVEGTAVASGELSPPVALGDLGSTTVIEITATSPDAEVTTYTLDVVRGAGTYFKHEVPQGNDRYGRGLDIDGATLAVGAIFDDTASADPTTADVLTDSGGVFVYHRDGSGWSLSTFIKASDAQEGDSFGAALAVDGNTLVVGAPGRNDGAGAVYVFRRSAGVWSEIQILTHPSPDDQDRCGNALAMDGDVLVVGCVNDDSGATGVDGADGDDSVENSGAVLVFRLNAGGSFVRDAYLKPHNTGAGDAFGFSVDVQGDNVVVGAIREDTDGNNVLGTEDDDALLNSGAAYVFRHGAAWSQIAFLKASNADAGDEFGTDVAVSDQFIAVGAAFERSAAQGIGGAQGSNTLEKAGAVYAYPLMSGLAIGPPIYIKAFNNGLNDEFGRDVAMEGNRLLVGSYREASISEGIGGLPNNNDGLSIGAVYEYLYVGGTWTIGAYIKPPRVDAVDDSDTSAFGHDGQFSSSIAIGGGVLAVASEGDASNAAGVDDATGTWEFATHRYSGSVTVY
ncbi:MAG: hypothetical protein CMN30_25775 [Sandaracinus sp.]|nr:hypothetical protein [Sandaracinus sp.]|tara:strand:- start:2217 stop:4115 length:1899 start_codon:yes stop_codon:yes gene_type:complete